MVRIVNTTPHAMTFEGEDGLTFSVEPSGVLINAKVEESILTVDGIQYATPKFVSDPESEAKLSQLEAEASDNTVIIGSIIAAQAYPGRVMGVCPVPGFERVPPAEKRMRTDKFTRF